MITPEEVNKMKVVELRAELALRGLDSRGVKAVLADRLIAALGGSVPASAIGIDSADTGSDVEKLGSEPEDSPVKSQGTVNADLGSPVRSEQVVIPPMASPVRGSSPIKQTVAAPEPLTTPQEDPQEDAEDDAGDVAAEDDSNMNMESVTQSQSSQDAPADKVEKEDAGESQPEAESQQDQEEDMDVDKSGDNAKRKIEEVNGDAEDESKKEVKKQRREYEPAKIVPEHEPELDENAVLLDWYKCDLNLKISEEDYLSAEPWSTDEFPFAYAGVKATYGFTSGKLYYEVKWTDNKDVKLDFGEYEDKYVLRVGWSDLSSGLQLGQEKLSYGWDSSGKIFKAAEVEEVEEKFEKGDSVGILLSLDDEPIEMKFTKNGTVVGHSIQIPKDELEGKTLFPHILTRNVKFCANFGETDGVYTPEDGFTFISKIPRDDAVRGPKRADKKEECEFVMLCGLAGCGKTTWAKNYVAENVDKHYNILGTSIVVERSLKSQSILGSSNSNKTYEGFFQKAGKFVEKLIEVAPSRRRNYILDQSNVVAGAQRRKSGGFQGFVRRAVVIVPSEEEYQKRIKAKEQEQGKSVPKSTILEMKAGFCLPDVGEIFSAVDFVDLDRSEAQELITKYNKEGTSAGFGRPIPSRAGGMGRFQSRRGGRGNFRGGNWRARGGPPAANFSRGGPRGIPNMRGPPRGGSSTPRGLPPRGMGPPRGGRGGPPASRGYSNGNWRGSGGSNSIPTRASYQPRGSRGNTGRGGGGSWRGGDGSTFHPSSRGGYGQRSQNGWNNDPWANNRQNRGSGGFGGGFNAGNPWEQVPDQGFGQRWDSSGNSNMRNNNSGGTWQGYGGQTYGGYTGGRR